MKKMRPQKIRIVEVGPRDGLQNEKALIPTDRKIALIEGLSETGLQDIEITSFVSPKAIPQLADNMDVAQATVGKLKQKNITTWVLVPNERGLESAMDAGITHIAVFTAASNTFNQNNINKTIDESITVFKPVIEKAKSHGMTVRGYVSTAFWCPYEGKIDKAPVLDVCLRLQDLGVDELSIGDTIGKAVPEEVNDTVGHLLTKIPAEKLALHFHDTYQHALENIRAGLDLGISIYDSSIGGTGGCPYAPGASGNVATESVVQLMNTLGIETGIDLVKLDEATRLIRQILQDSRAATSL